MVKKGLFLFFFLICAFDLSATHYRAGEILYQLVGPQTYRCSVITYTKTSSAAADRDTVQINWGDGTIQTLFRSNGPIGGSGIPSGEELDNDIKKNVYIGQHTYASIPPPPTNFYVISFYDQNRIDGINNIGGGNSVDIPFYVEDTLKFPTDVANIGLNNSPVLLYPPIDFANVNDTFYHNPAAYDPDGDSLTFELIVPLQFTGNTVPAYLYPQQYLPGPTNTSFLNFHTGEYIWAVPPAVGVFNIAILIKEYRNGIHMGTMIRDMQIIVLNEPNDPPKIEPLLDTCVHAGSLIQFNVIASDPQAFQAVELTASGGPFFVSSNPATFSGGFANPVSGLFRWQTDCSHIRKQDYQVIFKAEDNYFSAGQPKPLTDLETWNIKVIAPPVQGLTAVASGNKVLLNWANPYLCASSPNFRGFSVWRKEGCDTFDVSYCETGLNGRGFLKIAENLSGYSYTDFTVQHGKSYTYCILAEFSKKSPNGIFEFDRVFSNPSDQVCVNLPFDVPTILNVDVVETNASSGEIFVRWARPKVGGNDLDTIQFPPPYKFEVFRSEGFNFSSGTLIKTVNASSYSLINDTTLIDINLNTLDNPYCYKILFWSDNDTVGFSDVASSVFLNLGATDQTLILSWQANVPWQNDSFTIFKLNQNSGLYDSLTLVYTSTFADTGLINDSTYCYFVRTWGHYLLGEFDKPLLNRSQKKCAVPIDTLAPCSPELVVSNDCNLFEDKPWGTNTFVNRLNWTVSDPDCMSDIENFNIYYSSDSITKPVLLISLPNSEFLYNHILDNTLAGCYFITAVDRVGNESSPSSSFCVENCPYYELPNTFTPNGDGANDLFTPISPWRFITKIEITITNRWGNEVFKSNDPSILWNGKDLKSGKDVNEGVYLFGGSYFVKTLNGEVKLPFSSGKKGGGFIHLIRGK